MVHTLCEATRLDGALRAQGYVCAHQAERGNVQVIFPG